MRTRTYNNDKIQLCSQFRSQKSNRGGILYYICGIESSFMKVSLSLSVKRDASGKSEILLSMQNRIGGRVFRMRAKSEVCVNPEYFSNDKGVSLSRKRIIASDVREWHIKAQDKLNGILNAVASAEINARKEEMRGEWLRMVVERHLHPERFGYSQEEKTFYELADEYLNMAQVGEEYKRHLLAVVRSVHRYEGFVRATDKERANFTFSPEGIDHKVLEDYVGYLRNEAELSWTYPKTFERLLYDYPAFMGKRHTPLLRNRGDNSIHGCLKRLHTMWKWLNETRRVKNDPFEGFRNVSERYGTPYYITLQERDLIARTFMPTRHLAVQRDIFVFQCLVGCRVSDLMRLSECNIRDGILEYTPRKTKDEGEVPAVARVPLLGQATELVDKYRGVDVKGRLFPFISAQRYNDAIKEVFRVAGVTREVEVRNSLTGEIELRPINEVASSHIARRTFIGNLYQQVQDPNLIGKMSGHAEGSTAFARYRKIEDDTLRRVIETIK